MVVIGVAACAGSDPPPRMVFLFAGGSSATVFVGSSLSVGDRNASRDLLRDDVVKGRVRAVSRLTSGNAASSEGEGVEVRYTGGRARMGDELARRVGHGSEGRQGGN